MVRIQERISVHKLVSENKVNVRDYLMSDEFRNSIHTIEKVKNAK